MNERHTTGSELGFLGCARLARCPHANCLRRHIKVDEQHPASQVAVHAVLGLVEGVLNAPHARDVGGAELVGGRDGAVEQVVRHDG
eukprot:1355104-Rhodomonas_salina.1